MRKPMKQLFLDFALLVAGMLAIVFFWRDTVLVSAILACISAIMLIYSEKAGRVFFIIVAIGATIIESLTISTGAWVYSTRHIFLAPVWIPLYWGMVGIVMKDIYLIVKEKII